MKDRTARHDDQPPQAQEADMDYETLARGLLRHYRDIALAEGLKARQIAAAHFNGMCDAAHRLGIGMTPEAVHHTVLDVVRSGLGKGEERPIFRPAGDNADLKQFDADQVAVLATALKAL